MCVVISATTTKAEQQYKLENEVLKIKKDQMKFKIQDRHHPLNMY